MFADIAHGEGRFGSLVQRIAEGFRMLWSRLAAVLAPAPAPAEIDWEDGESR